MPLLLMLLLAVDGQAGRRDRSPPTEPSGAAPTPVALPTIDSLFPAGLPASTGPVPAGLANLSAQGCRACHPDSHDGWTTGHGGAATSEPWRAAAVGTGDPTCRACHLPLASQHPGDGFDAGLSLEGVTCAACHVRDGVVLTRRTVDAPPAPHALAHAPELADGTVCAACHQLTWAGADRPLYDTWGEWERSAYAEAGVGCMACHAAHGGGLDPARAVSVLIDVDRVHLTRGAEPLTASVALQNTGAGHAFPAGSPHRGVRVEIALERAADPPAVVARAVTDLVRTLGDGPPWVTVADTRLAAGEQRTIAWSGGLPADAAAGAWDLRVTLTELAGGEIQGDPFVDRRLRLTVD